MLMMVHRGSLARKSPSLSFSEARTRGNMSLLFLRRFKSGKLCVPLSGRGIAALGGSPLLAPGTGSCVPCRGLFWWKSNKVTPPGDDHDPVLQGQYLKALNDRQQHDEVRKRFESGRFAQNHEGKREYLRAMTAKGLLGAVSLEELRQLDMTSPKPAAQEVTVNLTTTRGAKVFRGVMLAVQLLLLGVFVVVIVLADFQQGQPEDEQKKKAGILRSFMPDAHTQVTKDTKVTFNDIRGIDDAKQELMEVVEYLKNPQRFEKIGARLPKGVLLIGEPGTGKTLMARAIAGEAGCAFLYASASSFDELFVGVGPARIRKLFEDAIKQSPCIIFIDEIDAIGEKRRYSPVGNHSSESTLNQLLTELDGFRQNAGIVVIAATNFAEVLDPALVRPGRFDKIVYVPTPDAKGRKEILDFYLSKVAGGSNVDSKILAKGTPGFTGAELSNLINSAAIKAALKEKEGITLQDVEEAKDDILMGIRRRGEDTEENRKLTAYHETGHALVALYTEGAMPLHKATIIERGNALGVTTMLPDEESSMSRQQLVAAIAVAMGGRAAEELIVGDDYVSSGASSDFKSATEMAYSMVSQLGMSEKVGHITINFRLASQEDRQLIDAEVKKLLNEGYAYALDLLQKREHELHYVAQALLEHETLTVEEIELAAGGKKLKSKL